ncbi:MAG TPA: hypothetical protein VGR96_14725 [Acidobacteriaceae bacterium]|nr:hypothetical protein [Acidobacteriaceae bacterium]
MVRASVVLLLALCGAAVGCETGSTTENVSTTGWKGQKVGQSTNDRSGLVTSSTTGTPGYLQNPQPKPPQDEPPARQNLDSN